MRSFYLDDMVVAIGTKIICKANICSEWIPVGRIYTVMEACSIIDDVGTVIVAPSARFQEVTE